MRSLVILAALMLAGCATPNIILVHPRSGDLFQCSSTGIGIISAAMANSFVAGCVRQYEAIGFVQAEKLTPEEKSKIPLGGKMRGEHGTFSDGTLGGGTAQAPPPLPNFGNPQKPAGLNLLCQDAIARSDRGAMMVHCQ